MFDLIDLNEKIRGRFCRCSHEVTEHDTNGKCYGLDFNGSVYSCCRCVNMTEEFCFVLPPMEFDNVPRIQSVSTRNRIAA